MTIRIEILSRGNSRVTSAMYYEIPPAVYSADSTDNTRVPSGVALSAQELKALKDGELVEVIDVTVMGNRPMVLVREALQEVWADGSASAIQKYKNDYTSVGQVWDGTWR